MPAKAARTSPIASLCCAVQPRVRRETSCRLLDAAIFNLIIGNADAHAKNFSLLHLGGTITLAPLYDLLSTILYAELSPKLAMKIGGKAVMADIEPRHWDRFASDTSWPLHSCERVSRSSAMPSSL